MRSCSSFDYFAEKHLKQTNAKNQTEEKFLCVCLQKTAVNYQSFGRSIASSSHACGAKRSVASPS